MHKPSEVTDLLAAWGSGDPADHSRLMEAVYGELKHLARSYLRREAATLSLSPTGLVHEAYLKLIGQRQVQWQNRHHFFGIAAQAMRRILVDRARAAAAAKRDGRHAGGALMMHAPPGELADIDVLALEEALSRLEALEARWAHLVELRFFAGLTVVETADVMGTSPATVKRDWNLARAWLYRELRSAVIER